MADTVTFIDNRRKDRVLLRVDHRTPAVQLLALYEKFDARTTQPMSDRIPSLDRLRSFIMVSVPVPEGKTKHMVRRAIRAAGKSESKPLITASKRVAAAVGTSTRSYIGRRSQGN